MLPHFARTRANQKKLTILARFFAQIAMYLETKTSFYPPRLRAMNKKKLCNSAPRV